MNFLEPALAKELLSVKNRRDLESDSSSSDEQASARQVSRPASSSSIHRQVPLPASSSVSSSADKKGKRNNALSTPSKTSRSCPPRASSSAVASTVGTAAGTAAAGTAAAATAAAGTAAAGTAAADATAAAGTAADDATAAAGTAAAAAAAAAGTAAAGTSADNDLSPPEAMGSQEAAVITAADRGAQACEKRIAALHEDLKSLLFSPEDEVDKMEEIAYQTAQLQIHRKQMKLEEEQRKKEELRKKEEQSQEIFRLTQQSNNEYLEQEYNDWEREEAIRKALIQDVIDKASEDGTPLSKPVLKLIDYFKGKCLSLSLSLSLSLLVFGRY